MMENSIKAMIKTHKKSAKSEKSKIYTVICVLQSVDRSWNCYFRTPAVLLMLYSDSLSLSLQYLGGALRLRLRDDQKIPPGKGRKREKEEESLVMGLLEERGRMDG